MLTYQLHTRVFFVETGEPLVFPNKATIEILLGPATSFGAADAPSRTLVRNQANSKIIINANTGRWLAQSRPPLEKLEVILNSSASRLILDGNQLSFQFECMGIDELQNTIMSFKWILPPLLNLAFPDPPLVESVRGNVGPTKFHWQHEPEEWRIHIKTSTKSVLEEKFATAFETLPMFNNIGNRRLAASLSYFHTAVRLSVAGDSSWEFMSETILNYAKCLGILFVVSKNSNDDVRAGLAMLGYTPDEIDGDFIPILILRSQIDVAHPRVAIHKPKDLKVLYKYLALT